MKLTLLLLSTLFALTSPNPILPASSSSVNPHQFPGSPPPLWGPCGICTNFFRHCLEQCGPRWECQPVCAMKTCSWKTAVNTRPCFRVCGFSSCDF
ncbi:hypothetical protein EJ04DRAFT_192939 [Polyplosphaeria fusca]|uniref:Uncharacterized protein n=1 Tax=Polyplosphaeria fusca TaxID=682080 RepID=A0A9P4V4P4_9PLEO|nr:hypothetical protein EJ04DRAFT_192939 [Polyplosphaeria fusca]